MPKGIRHLFPLLILFLAQAACNLPQATPALDANVLTLAAQTIQADLTQIAMFQPPATFTLSPDEIIYATEDALFATQEQALLDESLQPFDMGAAPAEAFPTIPGMLAGIALTSTPQPPTVTPTPRPPMSPTPLCDVAQYLRDVTIPDGTVLLPGQRFTKTWRFKNIGVCTWNDEYQLFLDAGEPMGGSVFQTLAGDVAPGDTVDFYIELKAPLNPGAYRGYWRLRNPAGVLIPVVGGYQGGSFYVDIVVALATPTPTFTLTPSITPSPTLTATPSPTATLTETPTETSQP